MTWNLDVVAGVSMLISALCLAVIFTFSSPKATNWPTFPESVRYGLGAAAVVFAWRGANLLEIGQHSEVVVGRINAEGTISWLVVCYIAITVTWHFSHSYLRRRGWETMAHVWSAMRHKPELAPVMVDPTEVAHAQGIWATGPGEHGEAAVREARRIPLPVD